MQADAYTAAVLYTKNNVTRFERTYFKLCINPLKRHPGVFCDGAQEFITKVKPFIINSVLSHFYAYVNNLTTS